MTMNIRGYFKYTTFLLCIFMLLFLCDKFVAKFYVFSFSGINDIIAYNIYFIYLIVGVVISFDELIYSKKSKYINRMRLLFGTIILIIIYMPMINNKFPLLFSSNFIAPMIVGGFYISKSCVCTLQRIHT